MTHFADITPYTSFPRSRKGTLKTKLEWSLHPTDVSIFLVMDYITLKNTNNTTHFSVDFLDDIYELFSQSLVFVALSFCQNKFVPKYRKPIRGII